MKNYLLISILVLSMILTPIKVFASESAGVAAEDLLSSLAQDKKNERILEGTIMIAMGGVTILGTSLLLESEGFDIQPIKNFFYLTGGLCAGIGIFQLLSPTVAEKEYRKVSTITDPIGREKAAYSSLISLAEKARYQRMVSGLSSGAFALYCLFGQPFKYQVDNDTYDNSIYYGVLSAAAAVSSLCFKSPEERILDVYEGGQAKAGYSLSAPNFRLGVLPQGKIYAAYSYSF